MEYEKRKMKCLICKGAIVQGKSLDLLIFVGAFGAESGLLLQFSVPIFGTEATFEESGTGPP